MPNSDELNLPYSATGPAPATKTPGPQPPRNAAELEAQLNAFYKGVDPAWLHQQLINFLDPKWDAFEPTTLDRMPHATPPDRQIDRRMPRLSPQIPWFRVPGAPSYFPGKVQQPEKDARLDINQLLLAVLPLLLRGGAA